MKIAYILPSLAFKGPILIAQSIVNKLESKVDIDVYYFDDILETEFNVTMLKINFKHKIDFNSYDIIHSHMLRPDLYILLWSFLGKCKKPKKITTIHQFIDHDLQNQHFALKAKLVSKLWHYSFKKLDTLVTLNQPMYDFYKLKYPNKNIVKIHNGIETPNINEDITQFDEKLILNFKKDYVCLGSAAQITKNKGFDQVLKLLILNKKLCFVLIGEGKELYNLKLLVKQNNISDRVLFLGKRNNAKKYFKYFDIFTMTSEKEGFPVSLLEAASLSLPSICTKNKIFEGLFSSNEVSFFEQNNIASLNEAVNNIIDNKECYAKNINNRFVKEYTSKTMANNYFKIYKYLLKN